ncbi:MAG: ABC-F family ATP-binding cassette domain-containing protein [Anaerolineae bacterium]
MSLIATGISKTYGVQPVLKEVGFTLAPGQRIGLVGANGAGKSTLLKIIAGEVEPDAGTIHLDPHEMLGYLPQVLTGIDGKTMDTLIRESLSEIRRIENRMRELESRMGSASGDDLDGLMHEYGDLMETYERRGGYDVDHRIDVVIDGMGIAHLPRDRQMITLSGGEKTRVALAMLLLASPDVLLLDEPTNHLDAGAMAWLESYLAAYKGAALIVSHDRVFLNRTVNVIVEIDEFSREAKRYTGDYDTYRAAKQVERAGWEESYWAEQEEIKALRQAARETARQVGHNRPMRDGNKMAYDAHGEKVHQVISRNVRNAEERLRRIQDNPIPRPPEPLTIRSGFDPRSLHNPVPLVVSDVSKAYGGRPILRGVSFALGAGERAVIVAPNGAGKSTLIRLIAGTEKPDTGEIIRAGSAAVGYLDQEGDGLPLNAELIEAYRAHPNAPTEFEHAKAELLRYGLFVYGDLHKRVRDLSAGQRRKLQLALLLASRPNLLLLDEPTNHLSFDVLEAFEAALETFPGAILAVSHDRRFLERMQTHAGAHLWALRDGVLHQWERVEV